MQPLIARYRQEPSSKYFSSAFPVIPGAGRAATVSECACSPSKRTKTRFAMYWNQWFTVRLQRLRIHPWGENADTSKSLQRMGIRPEHRSTAILFRIRNACPLRSGPWSFLRNHATRANAWRHRNYALISAGEASASSSAALSGSPSLSASEFNSHNRTLPCGFAPRAISSPWRSGHPPSPPNLCPPRLKRSLSVTVSCDLFSPTIEKT